MDFQVKPGHITDTPGFSAAVATVDIMPESNRQTPNLSLIVSDVPAVAAGVFTRNQIKAAPVLLSQRHLQKHMAQAIICNCQNANCCTPNGDMVALKTAQAVAEALAIPESSVLLASTGIIGQPMPVEPILEAVPALVEGLAEDCYNKLAKAILTTDTCEKTATLTYEDDGNSVTISAIAKGSGMIHPNMGTMLAFVTTNACFDDELLQQALENATDETFNMISVDGDTSTNDTVFVLANGLSHMPRVVAENESYYLFEQALTAVLRKLARDIAADGEGATKLLTVQVSGAKTKPDARLCAKSVATSSLFKSALFGKDPNWGRILCAAGYSGATLDPEQIDVILAADDKEVTVCEGGWAVPFDEDLATEILGAAEVIVKIDLGLGEAAATAYGCDLTYDYVRINGDYRS